MDSTDGSEQRGTEGERINLVPVTLLEDLTNINESDKEEVTTDVTDEVPQYRSRSREEVEIGSSVGPGAGNSGVFVETEIEREPNIAFVHNTIEKEDHEAVDFNEINKIDPQRIHEDTVIKDILNLDTVTERQASHETLVTHDFTNDQTQTEDDKILGMNIKVAAEDDSIEESVLSVLTPTRKENIEYRETVVPEEAAPVPEITTTAEFREFESDKNKEVLENNAKLKVIADTAEQDDAENTNREKTQSSETGNIVAVAVMDDFDIETTEISVAEADVSVEIGKEEEKVLEMNIGVEECKTEQDDAEKESELNTFVDQQNSHEVVDLKEKLTELEEFSSPRHGEVHASDLLTFSELKPVSKFASTDLENVTLNGVPTPTDKEDDAAAELEGKLSTTNSAESPVPFGTNGIEEAIEFIDSETLELQKGPSCNGKNHTETVADLANHSSSESDTGRFLSDKGSSSHGDELESASLLSPRPLQPLNKSSPHLAGSSNDNIFGLSTEATKPIGRSRIRKPEWMRRSLRRNGSVRRLFSRMRSKRFDHNQRPLTPELEPRPPSRPFRQMVVDFLLLLFES